MPGTASIQYFGDYFTGSSRFLYFLTSPRAHCLYANDLFLRHFGNTGSGETFISLFEDKELFRHLIGQCFVKKGEVVQAALSLKRPGGPARRVDWEFSACKQGSEDEMYVQAVGVMSSEEGSGTAKAGMLAGSLPERYKAYEQSREGLWRFDSDVPVSIDAEPADIIKYWRKHSRLVECNENMARMYGYEKAEELIGTRLEQLMDFSDEPRVSNLRKFIQNGFRSTIVETREFDRHGNVKYFLNSMEGIINQGKLTTVWGTQQDITEQRLAEEKIRYLALLVGNVSDIIVSYDTDFNVVSWNKAATEVLGYTEEEMKGKKIGDVINVETTGITRSELLAKLQETGEWKGESRLVNKRGKTVTLLTTSTRIFDDAGNLKGYVTVSKDITAKRIAEEQLQASEQFYRNLIAESLDVVLITDPSSTIRFASPSVTTILGYLPEEIVGVTTFDFAHPDDRDIAKAAFAEELTGVPRQKYISIRIRNGQGEWVWCIVRGHNLLENPYIHGMVVYLYDDSLRKQTEQALIESENRFRTQATLLNNVTDVIVTTDMNRMVTSWNRVCENLTGILSSQAIGRLYREVMETSYHPFSNEQVFEIVQKEGIWRGEISFRGFEGETKYLLHTITLLQNEKGESTGMMGVGKDITERKKIESQLQQSESFYRALAANSLDGILLTDITAKIIHCGPSVFHISGYQLDQMLGKNIFDFVHPDDSSLALKAFNVEIKHESVVNYIVIRLRHATRGWVWCTVRGHNLLHDPVLKAIVIYFTDDTKRKQIEDRLRESESRFRKMIHNLKLGVILQNERSEMLVCNQAALDMLGITEEQLLGKTPFDLHWNVTHEDGTDFPAAAHPVPMAIATKKPVRDVVMGVFRPGRNDRVWLLVNAEPVFDEEKNFINVISSFTDITEQRRISQQLVEQEVQRQRLITQATIDGQEKERQEIGKELHDNINQHLTTTRLYLEVAREKAAGEVLEMINLAHKNLADIVNEIRMLSQSLVPPTLGDLGLVESVQDLCDSLRRTHSFKIELYHRQFSENDLPENMKLMIFRIIQEQVNNILRHAQAKTISIRLQTDAENINFSIADDGQGFDSQRLKKGMGFSNISNRAGLFDGKVEIKASPGQGCTVTVTIPLSGTSRD